MPKSQVEFETLKLKPNMKLLERGKEVEQEAWQGPKVTQRRRRKRKCWKNKQAKVEAELIRQ